MPHILNRRGEEISPLQGLFYRTLHLLESGIKPVFVFDGQAPALKQPVLARRAEAAAARRGASDPGTAETQWRRLREDCKTLLGYLGVPCVQAPSEAEATCAALAKSGLVWATATEDMDALAFGSPRLLRHLRVTGSGEVEEISLPHVLQRLDMTPEQFVDLCILLGCDYCGKVRGLGPKKALRLLRQHGSIEQLLQHLDPQKHPLPEHWDLAGARRLFLQPTVADVAQVTLEWRDPEPEALVQFLAHEKHMSEVRVRRRLDRWLETQRQEAEEQPEAPACERQPLLGEFFPASKRGHPREGPCTRSSTKRQKEMLAEEP
ncbi:putative flap endonuclease 1-like protein [Alligator mississippiensis]|uniref:Flap endonuclease 1-like protein n=1 Tax=Alligator mississippiensis TaxID=8496 RepID=A0A151MG63_ALLMI|nr:putative flap endonuclease 1-like protein [Alligator mississippiensis]